jgi:hypothetical protein
VNLPLVVGVLLQTCINVVGKLKLCARVPNLVYIVNDPLLDERHERVMAAHVHVLTPTVQALSPTETIQEDMDDGVRREWGGLLQELRLAQLQLARMRQVVEVVDAAGDKKGKKEDDSDEGGTHPPRRPEERSSSNTPVAGQQPTGESHVGVRGDGEEDQDGHEEVDNDDVSHIVVVVFFTVEVHRFHGHHDGHQGALNPHSHLVGSNRQDNSDVRPVTVTINKFVCGPTAAAASSDAAVSSDADGIEVASLCVCL